MSLRYKDEFPDYLNPSVGVYDSNIDTMYIMLGYKVDDAGTIIYLEIENTTYTHHNDIISKQEYFKLRKNYILQPPTFKN